MFLQLRLINDNDAHHTNQFPFHIKQRQVKQSGE